jgi:hypothetical protein
MRIKYVDLMVGGNVSACYQIVDGSGDCRSKWLLLAGDGYSDMLKPCAFILAFLYTLLPLPSLIFKCRCVTRTWVIAAIEVEPLPRASSVRSLGCVVNEYMVSVTPWQEPRDWRLAMPRSRRFFPLAGL